MLYPSDIVDQVFGLTPDKTLPAWDDEPSFCSHCARPIDYGDHYSPSRLGSNFSNTADLACGSRVICWRCMEIRKQAMLFGLNAAVVTLDGVFPIFKDVHKAWLFTAPPKAPFVATHTSATLQHLAWRTPVTLDNRRISIRYGDSLFTVRPEKINQALSIADEMNDGLKKWINPLWLERSGRGDMHGRVMKKASEILTPEQVNFLENLSAGEYWALSYVMHAKRPVPTKPDCIKDTILSKLRKA